LALNEKKRFHHIASEVKGMLLARDTSYLYELLSSLRRNLMNTRQMNASSRTISSAQVRRSSYSVYGFILPSAMTANNKPPGIALYRALLIQCPKIPLPDDLKFPGPVNPIKHFIRNRFKKNVFHVSPKIVVSALEAGYAVRHLPFLDRQWFL
jgi:hypothetical protein